MGKRKVNNNQYKNKSNKVISNKPLIENKPTTVAVHRSQAAVEEVKILKDAAPNDERKLIVVSNKDVENDIAVNVMKTQLKSNTVIILSLKNDIANKAIEIEAKDATIALMKIDQRRLNSALKANSEQNEILEKELLQTKLKNKSVKEEMLKMNEQNVCLNEGLEGYKNRIKAAEMQKNVLELQLDEATQNIKAYEDERKQLIYEVDVLKRKGTKQLEEVEKLKLTVSKCESIVEQKNEDILQMKKREVKRFQRDTNTVAKMLAENSTEVSLLQVQKEQERRQREDEISNLSTQLTYKEAQIKKLHKENDDLEANLETWKETFYGAGASVQELVGCLIKETDRKNSNRCIYQPWMKRSGVTSPLKFMRDKLKEESIIEN